jgi:hypothetical protein
MLIWEVEHSRPLRRGFKEYRRHYEYRKDSVWIFLGRGRGFNYYPWGGSASRTFPQFFPFSPRPLTTPSTPVGTTTPPLARGLFLINQQANSTTDFVKNSSEKQVGVRGISRYVEHETQFCSRIFCKICSVVFKKGIGLLVNNQSPAHQQLAHLLHRQPQSSLFISPLYHHLHFLPHFEVVVDVFYPLFGNFRNMHHTLCCGI